MYIKIVLKGYWTSQLCGSIGIHVHLSTRTLLNESQSISAQRHGYRLGMALALRASMSLAVWANTALDHQRARLWLCSCSLSTALRQAQLWLFGHSSSGEHGSGSLDTALRASMALALWGSTALALQALHSFGPTPQSTAGFF